MLKGKNAYIFLQDESFKSNFCYSFVDATLRNPKRRRTIKKFEKLAIPKGKPLFLQSFFINLII